MNARLLRALQKGGCVAKTGVEEWSVWRTPDRRGRAIGTLNRAAIERLCLSKRLSPLGVYEDGRLVWSGEAEPVSDYLASPKALLEPNARGKAHRPPILHRILEGCRDPEIRDRLLQAALEFSEDMERATTSGRPGGMNWQGIASGTSIQGGGRMVSSLERVSYAAGAERRLTRISEAVGPQIMRVLERVILEGATRNAVSNLLMLKPVQAQHYCAEAMVRLADAYDQVTCRPEQVIRRSA